MTDLAVLELRMNSAPVKAANDDLQRFTTAARSAEGAADSLGKAGTAAGNAVLGGTTRAGQGAKLAAHEVRNLSFQINDIATGLMTGQSPFMIMAQQSGQVAQILGNRGLKSAIAGIGQGLMTMINPVTIGLAAIAAGGYAAAAIFEKVKGSTETLETVMKRHQETMQTLKASYGDAGASLEEFAAEGRNVVDALSRIDTIGLEKQLRSLSDAAKYGFGDLAQGASGGGFSVANQFKAFEEPLNRFFATLRAGHPDVRQLRSELSDLANIDPTNAALQEAYQKAIALTDGAAQAQAAILGMAGAMTTLGQQTSNAIQQLEALLKVAPTASEQADEIYRKAMLSAKNPGERASIEASYLSAQDRIAGETMPVPKKKPNYLSANPDGSYGSASSSKAAERAATAAANAYRDLIKNAHDRIGQMQVEIETVGMAEAAAEKYRMQQELLATATDKGRAVSEPMRQEIEKVAEEYGRLAEQVAKARLEQDLLFDRRQLGRTSIEQTVASTLRGAGLPEDLNSTEAQMIRLNEQLAIGKDMAMGFTSTFISDLREGKSVLESLGGALDNLADKLIQMATDQLISGLFGQLAGVLGGGGGFMAIGGTGGMFADGGLVRGPGTSKSDSIPARLSNGEYVINAGATARHRDLLDAINFGGLPGFASGGFAAAPGAEAGPELVYQGTLH